MLWAQSTVPGTAKGHNMRKHLIGGLLAFTTFFLYPARAAAQVTDTFMLAPGIPGDSTDEAHRNWIDVISVTQSFDAAAKASSACGAAITKGFDKAGPLLWLAAVTGQRFAEIRIEVVHPGEQRLRFYELRIVNARISAIDSMPSSLSESLQIAGDAATLSYYPQAPDGSQLPPVTANVTCR
jgi:type VI secretion system secreted protein Hcp